MTGVGTIGLELGAVGVGHRADVARELDDGDLEPEADPEERQAVLARPAHRLDHPLHAAIAEAARHQQPVVSLEQLRRRILVGEPVAADPLDVHADVVGDAAVSQRLVHRLVRVVQVGVLADHRDPHPARRVEHPVDHLPPRA